jgi:two-component system OmpR family response regulator/two-component system copper resistance phosphate regulon response regulator CusR
MNILIVDDDEKIRKSVLKGLGDLGHECEGAANGDRAVETILRQAPDLILLDLMIPGKSGLEILSEIRAQGVKSPVIILTAMSAVQDRVEGLKLGADDYLVKPFAFDELVARIEAVSRRTTLQPAMVLAVGAFTLDLSTHRAEVEGRKIDLSPTEFSVLELLMRHEGRVVTRNMLCKHVWGFEWGGSTNAIEVQINRLRRKVDRSEMESLIKTIRGRGYALRASADTENV